MFPIAVTTYDYTTPCHLLCCPPASRTTGVPHTVLPIVLPPPPAMRSCPTVCTWSHLCPTPWSYYAPLQWYCFCPMCLLTSPVYTFPPALYCVQGCNVLTPYKKMKDLPLCISVTCIAKYVCTEYICFSSLIPTTLNYASGIG